MHTSGGGGIENPENFPDVIYVWFLSPTSFLLPLSVMRETRNGGNDFVITRSDGPSSGRSVGYIRIKGENASRCARIALTIRITGVFGLLNERHTWK